MTTVEPTTTEAPIEEQEASTTEAPTSEEQFPTTGPVPEGTAFGSTPDFTPLIDDLRKKGSTQLTADTREALASLYKALKSQACGIYLATGAVARNGYGQFILRVFNLIKK